MKKLAGMAAVAVVSAIMAWSGTSLADRQEAKAPEHGTWEYQEALETGRLPSESVILSVQSTSDEKLPTVDTGGITYRIGVDTH